MAAVVDVVVDTSTTVGSGSGSGGSQWWQWMIRWRAVMAIPGVSGLLG